MNDFGHILSKHGVLMAFNIAKKVKQSEIDLIKNKLKETFKNDEELNEQLEKIIVLQVKSALNNQEIPGLITKNASKNPYDTLPLILKQKIVQISMYFSHIVTSEKLNKELILMITHLFLAKNKITQKDIIQFNKKYNIKSFVDQDYLDNDEDDEDGQP